ncbi:potassium-transporting ATPase subunit F [Senegalia massiliensis]|uniref:Potassium-transporting ATPase subunit F n=1 Tax=Senegalia massiliensis TaxID=1720316 RepID=A0A845QXU9_9CLOT|nr:potassium-transporting ATPase subunit F [Senegalia massiliensis]
MNFIQVISLITTIALLIYLFFVLIKGEEL